MVSASAAIGMALVALGMVLTPGPNMIYLVSRSVSQGWRAGMVSLLGTMVGFVLYMTMANLGLAAVFILVPWLYVGLKLAGAGYLLWLAWKTLRPGGVALFEARSLPRDSRAKLFRMGLLTNLLNPKAAVMYVALIPQFIDPSAGSVMLQGFVLGSIQISVSMLINAAIILVAGSLATFVATRPAWIRRQRKITGTMLGAAGIALAVEARTPATA